MDVSDAKSALQLASGLRGVVGLLKVGTELFTSEGPAVVRALTDLGIGVFLDLKFHDIPNTVAKAVAAATRLNVQMLTVHTSGGTAMMEAAVAAAHETSRQLAFDPPLILGVTVLTSMAEHDLTEIGIQAATPEAQVERLAKLAVDSGLRGLVCSPLELARLRKLLRPSIQLVTPGVRAGADDRSDQKRTLSAKEALAAGANWLVIGRPIYAAPDPKKAAEAILKSLAPA